MTIPPPRHDTSAIPRAIASDPFLAHSDDDTTTASLKRDEILPGSSSTLAPTQNRTQPIKRGRPRGSLTTALKAKKRAHNDSHSHQPTARLAWDEEIDGDQSFQNNPEIWAQSEATEINNLIQSGAFSPVYNGPAQSNLKESSRHINIRFHALRSKADCEARFPH